tara:strand:+ start:84 stop:320 length:237 start_codon:yes stop_codon:yes gene_type:complete
MDYGKIRRDMISAYLLRFFLERNKILMPKPEDAARSAVSYANALIHDLDLSKDDHIKRRQNIIKNIIFSPSKNYKSSS